MVSEVSTCARIVMGTQGYMAPEVTRGDAATPAGAVAFKKFKIGKGMDVEVKIAWNQQRTVENGDAHIDITFTAGELVEESLQQRQELGVATDEERVKIRYNTGVNYYTVRPKVKADQVGKRVAY